MLHLSLAPSRSPTLFVHIYVKLTDICTVVYYHHVFKHYLVLYPSLLQFSLGAMSQAREIDTFCGSCRILGLLMEVDSSRKSRCGLRPNSWCIYTPLMGDIYFYRFTNGRHLRRYTYTKKAAKIILCTLTYIWVNSIG